MRQRSVMRDLVKKMLSYFGGDRRVETRPDPVKQDVEARQVQVARRLSKITGEPPAALLDYSRYDTIIGHR